MAAQTAPTKSSPKWLETNPNLRLLHSPTRLGKGKGIKNAVNAARGKYVMFMDVDLATDLACLPKLLATVKAEGRYGDWLKTRQRRSSTSATQTNPLQPNLQRTRQAAFP